MLIRMPVRVSLRCRLGSLAWVRLFRRRLLWVLLVWCLVSRRNRVLILLSVWLRSAIMVRRLRGTFRLYIRWRWIMRFICRVLVKLLLKNVSVGLSILLKRLVLVFIRIRSWLKRLVASNSVRLPFGCRRLNWIRRRLMSFRWFRIRIRVNNRRLNRNVLTVRLVLVLRLLFMIRMKFRCRFCVLWPLIMVSRFRLIFWKILIIVLRVGPLLNLLVRRIRLCRRIRFVMVLLLVVAAVIIRRMFRFWFFRVNS